MSAPTKVSMEHYRHIAGPPALVWALACDTNRWDRAVGAPPSTYSYELVDTPFGRVRDRIGTAKMFWGDARWLERGEWIEGKFLRGERHFEDGLLKIAGYRVEVEETKNGETDVKVDSYVIGRMPMPEALAASIKKRSLARIERYLDALTKIVEDSRETVKQEPGEPATAWARRAIVASGPSDLYLGRRSKMNEANFEYRAKQLAKVKLDDDLRDKLLTFVRDRSDDQLAQIRPYELARAWGRERRDVLHGFLLASKAGLYDLHWQAVCPTCRVPSDSFGTLEDLGQQAYCSDCDAHYGVDFSSNLETVFRVNAAIREVTPQVWCAGSPWFRPHVWALLDIPPGESRELDTLPPGRILLRTGFDNLSATMAEGQRSAGAVVSDHEVALEDGAVSPDAPLLIRNATDKNQLILIERQDYRPELALASDLITMPDFHGLIAMQAPATGVDLSIGSVTIMFCDLTASTALYQEIGDGLAFAIISDHFARMHEIIGNHRGALVKTMGDALMSTFSSISDAIAAAVQCIRVVAQHHTEHRMRLKVGLHEGSALAVRANGRIDFFGTTVNLASRLQHEAGPNQIVVAREFLDHTEVAEVIRREKISYEYYGASPKGLPGLMCATLDVPLTDD